jgi:aminoglycoside 6'-N-acetyltransferase I
VSRADERPSAGIEACRSPDHRGWLQLRQALWPHDDVDAHRAEMARFCAAPERFAQFIAYAQGGEPQGFVEAALRTDYVNGTDSSPVAFVEGIYVAAAWRGRGIARLLMAEVEAWARRKGCSELASDALLDNAASHAMHRALGFEETQRVVFFRKTLPDQDNRRT